MNFTPEQNKLIMVGMKRCFDEYRFVPVRNRFYEVCHECETKPPCISCAEMEREIMDICDRNDSALDKTPQSEIDRIGELHTKQRQCKYCNLIAGPENIKLIEDDTQNTYFDCKPHFFDEPDDYGAIAVVSFFYTYNLKCEHGKYAPLWAATYGIKSDGSASCYAS